MQLNTLEALIVKMQIRKNTVIQQDSFTYIGLFQDEKYTFYDIDENSIQKISIDAATMNP